MRNYNLGTHEEFSQHDKYMDQTQENYSYEPSRRHLSERSKSQRNEINEPMNEPMNWAQRINELSKTNRI